MTHDQAGFFRRGKPYIPGTLSEINDMLGSMILGAPTFIDTSGVFRDRNIESEFNKLVQSFGIVRAKFGEEGYAAMIDLAARAKALFAADQDDTNGKTDQGRALLFEMEDLLNDVRRRRSESKLPDDEGRVTGD